MKKIFIIGKYTLKDYKSRKFFLGSFFLTLIALLSLLFIGKLSIGERISTLKNGGLGVIEYINLFLLIYISTTHILKEIEEKSIYLILTKGVKKSQYVIGVYLGLLFLLWLNILMQGSLLGISLSTYKGFDIWFLKALFFIGLKLSILLSIGVFLSILSETSIFAIIFTFIIYFLGHFLKEMVLFLKATNSVFLKFLIKGAGIILPRFYLLNYRDHLNQIKDMKMEFLLIFYGIIYILIIIYLMCFFFRRREI